MANHWMRWINGRQNSGYSKMALIPEWLSKKLNADAYLLRLPEGTSVPKHKDPVEPGYNHHRMNICIWGIRYGRMYVLGRVKRYWRVEVFRPDIHEHGMLAIKSKMYFLSFGWKTKSK